MKQLSKKMLKHTLFLSFEILAGTVTAIFLIWLAMIWRLSQGPIEIDFFTETLEKSFSQELDADFGRTEIVWGGYRKPIEIHVNDVSIKTKDHHPIFSIDKIGIQLSKRYLLVGKVRAKSLTLFSPTLRIIRDVEGQFDLDLNNGQDVSLFAKPLTLDGMDDKGQPTTEIGDAYKPPDDDLLVGKIYQALKGEQDPDQVLAVLRRLSIRDADVVFEDRLYGGVWQAKSSNITIQKGARGATVSATTQMVVGDESMALRFNGFHDWQYGETQSIVTFSQIDPKVLAKEYQYLDVLNGVDLKLSGGLHVTLSKDLKPVRGRLLLDAGTGDISYQSLHKAALPITSAELKLGFDFEKNNSEVETLIVNLGDAKLSATAFSKLAGDRHQIVLDGVLEGMKIDDLNMYWPSELAPKPRKWVVEHLSKGTASKATLNAEASMGYHDFNDFSLDKIDGRIDFTDIKVDYFPPMKFVTGAAGFATYNKEMFALDIHAGQLEDMSVLKSNILIDGFKDRQTKINIDVDVKGPIRTALSVLDGKPLHFMDDFGVPIEQMQGDANVDLNLNFPLKTGLKLSEVNVKADAVLNNAVFPKLVDDMALSGGPLTLSVNAGKLNVSGEALLAGVNTTFDWVKNFRKEAEFRTRVQAKLNIDYPFLTKFGVPEAVAFDGSMASDITYTQLQNDRAVLLLKGDLEKTAFKNELLSLDKKTGAPGDVHLFLHFAQNQPKEIKSLSLQLDDLSMKGDVKLQKNAAGATEVASLNLSEYKTKTTDVSVELNNNDDTGYQVTVSGKTLDATSFLEMGKSKAENVQVEPEENKSKTPFEMVIDVQKLITGQKASLREAKVFVGYKGGYVDRLELDGGAGKGQVYLRYSPNKQGYHRLRFEADDAGAALRALNLSKAVKGGTLVIDMWPRPNGGKRDMVGKALLSGFRLVDAPVLAKLLNAMSLTGMGDLLSGKGMKFSKLRSRLIWIEEEAHGKKKKVRLLKIKDGQTSGSSLGLTFDGDYDQANNRLDLKGTVVPVSGVNKALSEIPLLGKILTGGGDAVFAATYRIKGTTKTPKVTVNPLAALAPGFLRKLFFEGN